MSDAKKLTPGELSVKTKEVVEGLIESGVMFTAFDVTREMRNQGFWVEHRDVKDLVHSMFERGEMSGTGYARSIVPIPGRSPAFCYHLYTDDVADYDPSMDHDDASVAPSVPSSAAATSAPAKPLNGGYCARDYYGRVNIPKALVKALGLVPGKTAWVYLVGDHFEIVNAATDNRQTYGVAKYIVNCQGNIRLSDGVLDKLSCTGLFRVSIDPSNSVISLMKA